MTINHRVSTSSRIALRACVSCAALALAAVHLAAPVCAQKSPAARDRRTPVQTVWPLPPDEARVRYLAVYAGSDDVGAARKSKTLSLKETLLGRNRAGSPQQNPNGFVKPFGVAAWQAWHGRDWWLPTPWTRFVLRIVAEL